MAASAAVSRRPADAEALAERSVKLLEIDNAVNRAVLLRPLQLMCIASLDSGHFAKARRAYERMLQVAGDTPEDRYLVHSAAARLLDRQEKFKDAETEILAAIDALQRTGRVSRGDEAALLRSLSLLRISQGKYAEARSSVANASAVLEIAKDFDPIDRADTLHVWAILHAKTGEWREAEQALREALAIVDEGNRTDRAFLRTLLLRYAEALRHIKRGREARTFEKRASTLVDPASANALVDVSELYPQSNRLR
jgi:tetratricopeptide (TPR) repeat protein